MDFFRICLMFFQRGLYMITKLNNRELFQFCEQFSIILRSGMSAIEGLAILNDDSQTERGKEILTFLYKDMEESRLPGARHGAIRCFSCFCCCLCTHRRRDWLSG